MEMKKENIVDFGRDFLVYSWEYFLENTLNENLKSFNYRKINRNETNIRYVVDISEDMREFLYDKIGAYSNRHSSHDLTREFLNRNLIFDDKIIEKQYKKLCKEYMLNIFDIMDIALIKTLNYNYKNLQKGFMFKKDQNLSLEVSFNTIIVEHEFIKYMEYYIKKYVVNKKISLNNTTMLFWYRISDADNSAFKTNVLYYPFVEEPTTSKRRNSFGGSYMSDMIREGVDGIYLNNRLVSRKKYNFLEIMIYYYVIMSKNKKLYEYYNKYNELIKSKKDIDVIALGNYSTHNCLSPMLLSHLKNGADTLNGIISYLNFEEDPDNYLKLDYKFKMLHLIYSYGDISDLKERLYNFLKDRIQLTNDEDYKKMPLDLKISHIFNSKYFKREMENLEPDEAKTRILSLKNEISNRKDKAIHSEFRSIIEYIRYAYENQFHSVLYWELQSIRNFQEFNGNIKNILNDKCFIDEILKHLYDKTTIVYKNNINFIRKKIENLESSSTPNSTSSWLYKSILPLSSMRNLGSHMKSIRNRFLWSESGGISCSYYETDLLNLYLKHIYTIDRSVLYDTLINKKEDENKIKNYVSRIHKNTKLLNKNKHKVLSNKEESFFSNGKEPNMQNAFIYEYIPTWLSAHMSYSDYWRNKFSDPGIKSKSNPSRIITFTENYCNTHIFDRNVMVTADPGLVKDIYKKVNSISLLCNRSFVETEYLAINIPMYFYFSQMKTNELVNFIDSTKELWDYIEEKLKSKRVESGLLSKKRISIDIFKVITQKYLSSNNYFSTFPPPGFDEFMDVCFDGCEDTIKEIIPCSLYHDIKSVLLDEESLNLDLETNLLQINHTIFSKLLLTNDKSLLFLFLLKGKSENKSKEDIFNDIFSFKKNILIEETKYLKKSEVIASKISDILKRKEIFGHKLGAMIRPVLLEAINKNKMLNGGVGSDFDKEGHLLKNLLCDSHLLFTSMLYTYQLMKILNKGKDGLPTKYKTILEALRENRIFKPYIGEMMLSLPNTKKDTKCISIVIPPFSTINLLVGKILSCCQFFGGQADTFAKISQISPSMGVLVVFAEENEKKIGLPILMSGFHYTKKTNFFVFDSIETDLDLKTTKNIILGWLKDYREQYPHLREIIHGDTEYIVGAAYLRSGLRKTNFAIHKYEEPVAGEYYYNSQRTEMYNYTKIVLGFPLSAIPVPSEKNLYRLPYLNESCFYTDTSKFMKLYLNFNEDESEEENVN